MMKLRLKCFFRNTGTYGKIEFEFFFCNASYIFFVILPNFLITVTQIFSQIINIAKHDRKIAAKKIVRMNGAPCSC